LIASPFNPDIICSAGYVYLTNTYWSEFSLTTDGGLTWYRDTLDSSYRANTACFDPNDANRLYLAGDSAWSYPYVNLSTDLGQSWQRIGTGLSGSVLSLCMTPGMPGRIYCGTTSGLYVSTDAGMTWTRRGTMTNVRAIVVDAATTSNVYCGTATGVYASTDAGETWQAFNTGLGTTDVLSLALRTGPSPLLFCGTNGGACYRTTLASGLADRPGPSRLAEFEIRPNPCAGATQLTVRLAHPARVSISDASGRCVWSTRLRPGSHSLEVPRLAAGVYLVRLTGEQPGTSQKLIVSK
jgi:photosystem II stability/assembly factor-like uncharacterized protein